MAFERKRLGEIVIRSQQPATLVAFYCEIIGLELFASFGSATFLKIDDDIEGYPQLLAVFDKTHEYSGPRNMRTDMAQAESGSLHHFAFALEKEAFRKEQSRLQSMGVAFQSGEHPAFGWRSIYLYDPDGNCVEFVCYDAGLFDPVLNKRVQPSG